jgi:hypothetical protein
MSITTIEKNQELAAANALIASLQQQLDAAEKNLAAIAAIVPVDPPTLGNISGSVRDQNGKGIAGIVIYNDANNDHAMGSAEVHTSTDASGNYSLTGLAAGNYKVRATLPNGWAQVKPTTPTGVDPTTAYYGLTISLAGGQVLSGQDFVFRAPVSSPVTPTDPQAPAGETIVACKKGLVGSTELATAGELYTDLGTKDVRVWFSTNRDWTQAPTIENFKFLKAIHDKYGTNFLVLITAPETKAGEAIQGTVPTPSKSVALWTLALNNSRAAGFKRGDLKWEINNEPDMLQRYWYGTLQQYMDTLLKPVFTYLHSQGEIVVGGATVLEKNFGVIVGMGYLDYCDIANHHPYDGTGSGQAARLGRILALCKGKALMASEWNLHFGKPPTDVAALAQFDANYVSSLKTAWAWIGTRLFAVYYFEYKVYASDGGHAGLTNADGSKHEPFYGMFKSMS